MILNELLELVQKYKENAVRAKELESIYERTSTYESASKLLLAETNHLSNKSLVAYKELVEKLSILINNQKE